MAKTTEQLITEQVQRWTQSKSGEPDGRTHWPVITVSREFGAGGAALAHALSERIGFKVWDKELVQAIAEKTGGDEALLSSLDEHRREAIEDAIRGALLGGPHSNLPYVRALMRVVRTIAVHGGSIIIGRGANYMLKPNAALRVRVVCPLEVRARRIAKRMEVDEQKARRRIVHMDAERAEFVRYHFRQDVAEPSDYDLVVNTGSFHLDPLADLVEEAYAMKFEKRPAVR